MQHLEIEVKFRISDLNRIRKKIIDAKAVPKGRFFESNILFDDKNRSLSRKKALLRLRKDSKNVLTLKIPQEFENNNFKILKESELEISDFEIMRKILEYLGFQGILIYEKYRETFETKDGTKILIDEMPFGNFLEIEGEKERIKARAEKLGLLWSDKITMNYHQLFEIIKREQSLEFSDITFDNFDKYC